MHFLHPPSHWLAFISVWRHEDGDRLRSVWRHRQSMGLCACARQRKHEYEVKPLWEKIVKSRRWRKVTWNWTKAGQYSCCTRVEALLRAAVICRHFTALLHNNDWRRGESSGLESKLSRSVKTGARVWAGRRELDIYTVTCLSAVLLFEGIVSLLRMKGNTLWAPTFCWWAHGEHLFGKIWKWLKKKKPKSVSAWTADQIPCCTLPTV